jgi:hypothetical protein
LDDTVQKDEEAGESKKKERRRKARPSLHLRPGK